jgi:phage head maturation protease
MNTQSGPRGWRLGQTATRFADTKPSSYSAKDHTVDCVISMGSPVVRFFGTECLRITPEAVDLSRMENGSMIPLLDSHQGVGIGNALGRFTKTWITHGALRGTIAFNQTPNGKLAEGMVERNEVAGISAGYSVNEWQIQDSEGRTIDPEIDRMRWDDDNLVFTATRWTLHDASLVSVPADQFSGIRAFGSDADRDRALPQVDVLSRGAIRITKRFGNASISYDYPPTAIIKPDNDVLARMQARQRMQERQTAYDDRRAVTDVSDRPAGAWRRASSVFP